jgi:hypothetical protein
VVCAKCINGCSYFSSWQLNLREQPEENSFFIRGFTKDATFLSKTHKSPQLQESLPPEDNQVKVIPEKLQFRT